MWEAANAPTRDDNPVTTSAAIGVDRGYTHSKHDPGKQHAHSNREHYGHGDGRYRHLIASSETVEAALSRLSKAYTTSMECIGAIHKTNHMILKEQRQTVRSGGTHQTRTVAPTVTTENKALQSIKRVSNVARTTLETAILLDPLMLPHAPILHQSMIELSNSAPFSDNGELGKDGIPSSATAVSNSSRWKAVQDQRPMPPTISSAAHKSTLVKLAYLSLVNYSDLLQQGSRSDIKNQKSTNEYTILDRGVVSRLQSLDKETSAGVNDNEKQCCWSPETPEETQRLAVAALCDASNLDGSDPVMWLKLACASRKLESLVAERHNRGKQHECRGITTLERSQHRRLQKHALERGSVALPNHMPPNRTILRALEEFCGEPEPDEYYSGGSRSTKKIKVHKKTLGLTRYSWLVLGKMIIRACKGEEATTPWEHLSPASLLTKSPLSMFGSPSVVLKLSPMLVLPSQVLGKICQYLENTSIWKFEATCRALSVNVIAARAFMEENDSEDDKDEDEAADMLLHKHEQKQREQLKKMEIEKSKDQNELLDAEKKGPELENEVNEEMVNEQSAAINRNENSRDTKTTQPKQSFRASKRLRSQQISTSKKQDRAANRKSFDYCFVAATLSCTKEKHNDLADGLRKKKELAHLFRGVENAGFASNTSGRRRTHSSLQENTRQGSKSMEVRERIGDSSLSAFVERWTMNNSGPMDVLERYLAHVALFAEDVFASDSPTMGLHSCIITSFQLLLMRSGSNQCIVPKFFKPITKTGSALRSLETFAMDLLNAELILRQCDRYVPKVVEFDDDANLISLMMPRLVESCNDLKEEINSINTEIKICEKDRKKFHVLEIRCYWLTACFYLWRSRIARPIYMSREAEDEGIHFIGMAIECFKSPVLKSTKVIKTPQLASPGREDAFWHEISASTLSKFRDEIQASSVVSHARQRFQELVAQLDAEENTERLSTESAGALAEIGRKLFERYNSQYGSTESKLVELVDNVLAESAGDLFLRKITSQSSEQVDETNLDITDFIQLDAYRVEDLKRVSNPTILSMLVICLNMDQSNRLSVAQLLLRLVLTTRDIHSLLLKQIADYRASRKQTDGYHSDSDSDDDMSDAGPQLSQKDDDEKKARQCGHFVKLLIKCLCIICKSYLSDDDRETLVMSDEFHEMINSVLDFSNQWFESTLRFLSITDDTLDQDLVGLIQKLLSESKHFNERSRVPEPLEAVFFHGLVKIIISQQENLKNLCNSHVKRSNRTAIKRLCIQRAQYIGIVASKLGAMLSTHLATVNGFVLKKSSLFEPHDVDGRNSRKSHTSNEEIIFLHAVRWLREFASKDVGESLTGSNNGITSNSFDRPIVKELKIPISLLVIGLCGSAPCSRNSGILGVVSESENHQGYPLSLTEFFDSDASINDWQSDSEEDNNERTKKELLRVICHAIQCIVLILDVVDEKDTITKFLENDCDTAFGPLLPLVSARVLNFFADTILLNFGDVKACGKNRALLWSEDYPYRARYIGELLDTALYKTYRWLYGFALVGEQTYHYTSGNECSHSTNNINEIVEKGFKLESTVAAGQLYRCIVRAYSGGRKTPPKQALEAVKAALPPHRESEQSKKLRRFMFSGENNDLDMNSLLNMNEQWDSPFAVVRDSMMENKDSLDNSANSSLDELEAAQVRRGLSKQLALGPLPVVASDPRSKSDAGACDDRSQTMCNEIAIAKKFNAILDDLCLSDADNWEGWYRAGQCCMMKADTIADRLGLTKGFSRIKGFSVQAHRGSTHRSKEIGKLKDEQEQEERMLKQVSFLGHDYSFYTNHVWSSLSALRDFVAKVKKSLERENDKDKILSLAVWNEIDSKFDDGKYLEGQEACGGLFVSALRNLSIRFLSVALYILQSKAEIKSDTKVLLSEICETLGNTFYSELMASQKYGWPMRVLTSKRKRDIAITAKACYVASIMHADDSVEEDDNSDDHSTWDLQFMVGKCDEKIAKTYEQEAFPKQTECSPDNSRLYEQHMSEAMSAYSKALAEANKLEDSATLLLDSGGSGHGSTEILYRLHASRLKCLIHSVSRKEEERGQAELEALRLTEKYHFKDHDLLVDAMDKSVHERIWIVFADVVDGLFNCRKLKPYFHRSVYRHAQALMWSPVFYDLASSKRSSDIVPATHSYQIKGLDSSKPAAFSAESVIGALFDKKRVQLCAVWVTNSGTASPFQAINSTVRKYDSLRGKYIGAYLETLRICNRRPEVETLMKWLYTSKRDLPSYFQAGAMNYGDKPTTSQTQDPLLVAGSKSSLMANGFLLSAKRRGNGVLADVLMHEISKKVTTVASSKNSSTDGNKITEFYLKHTYACYLRLNCSIEDLSRVRAWKYGSGSLREVEALCQAYLLVADTSKADLASTSDFGDWSGGGRKSLIFKAAVEKCKAMFPSLSANAVFGKSKPKKAKSGSNILHDDQDPDELEKGKRKSPSESSHEPTEKVSFEVAVPLGLNPGDTFLTSVKVGGSNSMKVKLKVPQGQHSSLRFHLNVPRSKMNQKNKKQKVNQKLGGGRS